MTNRNVILYIVHHIIYCNEGGRGTVYDIIQCDEGCCETLHYK